jgi:hypothetical protein
MATAHIAMTSSKARLIHLGGDLNRTAQALAFDPFRHLSSLFQSTHSPLTDHRLVEC